MGDLCKLKSTGLGGSRINFQSTAQSGAIKVPVNQQKMATIERIEAGKGEFVHVAVEWLVKTINNFIASDGECIIGLSGGAA